MPKKLFLIYFSFSFCWGCPLTPDCEPPCEAAAEPTENPSPYDDSCWGQTYANTAPLSFSTAENCLGEILLDTDISLLGTAGEMQVHLDADFDGNQLYLIYNTANTETEDMSIMGRTLKCDGSLGEETTINNQQSLFTDPQIAMGHEELMVLWQRDEPELGPNNLDLFAQGLQTNYEPLTSDNQLLELNRNGILQIKNAWMAAVSPARQGVYWGFGSRGHDEATAFQTFAQLLDSEATPLCDSFDLHFEPETGQLYPVVDAKNEKVLVAWESHQSTGAEIEYIFTEGGALHLAEPSITTTQGEAQRPAVALSPNGEQSALAYFSQSGSSIKLFLFNPQFPEKVIQVGHSGKMAHSPALALGENGGLIFWLENLSGLKNNAYFQAFQWQEDRYELLGTPTAMASEKVLPYAPIVLHLGAEYYFLGWVAGDHPNYQAYGRFVAPHHLQ